MKWLLPICLRLALALTGCGIASGVAIAAPDYDAIARDIQAGQYGPVNSLLIEHRGELVFERYFRGTTRDDLQLLNSVTKSVGSTLIGIAARRALLDTQATLPELLPQYAWQAAPLSSNSELKLEHVLQMRHGIVWDEWTHDFTDPRNAAVRMFASPDWYAFTLGQARDADPGSGFTYSSGVSTLMSGILRRASGESPQSVFQEWLAEPLGIERFDWELWNPAGPGNGQRTFPFGDVPLGVGLWLRPLDLLKLGRLYLDGGVHDGERLLDAEWIARAWTRYSHAGTDAYFATAGESAGYGYQWWYRALLDSRGRSHPCWYANGAGRQYLLVCPDDELVVVTTGDAYAYSGPGVFSALRERVLPELAHPIDDALSGFYFDPLFPGQGVSIEVVAERSLVVLAWYAHAEGGQRWYIMQGTIAGDRVVFDPVLRVEGGGFMAPTVPAFLQAGRAELQWDDCGRATLDYQLDAGQGRYELQRLVSGCE